MQYEFDSYWLNHFNNLRREDLIMASRKADVIIFKKEDWDGTGGGKRAASGKYRAKLSPKSKIKAGQNGNILNLGWVITGDSKGKKTKANGVVVYDNIAAHVVWKISQILRAIGVKKMPKKMTLQELLAAIKKYGKDIRIVVGVHKYQGKPQNDIGLYLPLAISKDEEDDDIDEDDEDEDADDEDSDDEDDEDSDDDEEDEDEDDDEEDSDDDDEDEDSDDDEDDEEDDDEEDDDDDSDDEDEDEDEDDDEDDEDEDDEDEDEDDDEDEAPRRGKKTKTKAKKPVAKKRAAKKTTARRGAKKGKRK